MISKRMLTAADVSAFYALTVYAFNKRDSEDRRRAFKQLYDNSRGYGLFVDDKLVSGFLGTPFGVNFYGQPFQMSGIGYVASYPEFAGHGSISQLMTLAFHDMHAQHVTLSYLAPFSDAFYRRFGYEDAFDQARHEMASRDLPRTKFPVADGHVERLAFADAIPLISKLHNEHPLNQHAGTNRQNWWWQYDVLKHPDWEVAVYFDAQETVQGYLIYEREPDTFLIHECFVETIAARQQLFNFVRKHQSAYRQFVYASGAPVQLHDLFADPQTLKTQIVPYMMARIVDVADFLAKYPYQPAADQTLAFNLEDRFLPENEGTWRLTTHNGQTTAEKVTAPAEITLTVQQLTKAAFGYRSLLSQHQYGELTGSITALQKLQRLLVTGQPMLWDYF
ncbi:GNAT family acetyltraansferase [Lactobacillus selangorensis]|uniref:GNAT family acetyltraansferase n=1 Tax=Lactobacillus selangorensis TaxID=81857 RepID=A0A0R2FNN6_9LACO|nr:GNAT family N-acetyltransferase [Lactobacillus selangorensis]KRN27597.1 GNAT family acetyltraansferase [Lactobacillus selangorensis]KRN30129.1 GNAT family acetyltraansferase [Lactobacillus selangorensis]